MKLVCFINLFTYNARLHKVDADDNMEFVSEIPVDNLAESLAAAGSLNGINQITLIGAPVFAEVLVPEIIEYAQTKFGNNDLIVEVMK